MAEPDQLTFTTLRPPHPQSDYVTIGWEIAGACNYRCSYCTSELQSSSPFPQEFAAVLRLVDDFQKLTGKRVAITLNGGEPTLWSILEGFLQECRTRNVVVDLISNGSRPASWWRRIAPQVNQIGLSFHPEFAQVNKFLAVVEAITELKSVLIYYMALPGAVKSGVKLGQEWAEQFPKSMVILKPLRKNMAEEFYHYSDEEWKVLRTQSGIVGKDFRLAPAVTETRKFLVDENRNWYRGRELIAKGLHGFKGWTCWAGIDNLAITTDGRIWRGTCREGGELGSLQTGWQLPEEPVICTQRYCVCQRDLGARKQKSQPGRLAQEMDVDSGLKRV